MLRAVIGAHFGDEAKGLVTDFFSTANTLVCRYNGGSQAGHTVITPEGKRHEFQHFGAGTFQGARTLFSRHTIVSPSRFLREQDELRKLTLLPVVYIDPRARVTTPFDMLINRAVEKSRGQFAHGSCGYGINETVKRSEWPQFRIEADLLRPAHRDDLVLKLRYILRDWVPRRCAGFGINVPAEATEDLIESFILDADTFTQRVLMVHDSSVLTDWKNVVFEGAQGLRLCETRTADMPYLTPSKPGLPNIIELLKSAGRTDRLDIYYVTRAYVTRHGAGPLPGDLGTRHPFGWTGPESNVPQEFQGQLRYALLTPEFLLDSLRQDRALAPTNANVSIALTCLDQVDNLTVAVLQDSIPRVTGLPIGLESYGPTRLHVSTLVYSTGE